MTEEADAPKGVSSHNTVSGDAPGEDDIGETVGQVSQLYLGNILYAIERCALSLEGDDKLADAAFYRGIGRKLADAYGREKRN